jgi:hypothetical protein
MSLHYYFAGLGPVAFLVVAGALFALWLTRRESAPARTTVKAVVAAVLVSFALLLVGLGWSWQHFWRIRPDNQPRGVPRTVEMQRTNDHDTLISGRAIYAIAFGAGLATAFAWALRSGISVRRSLLLTLTVWFVFLMSPLFIWLEFITDGIVGHAALLYGAVLAH